MYSLKSFENGFEYLEINLKNISAKIALQGAHIFEYKRNKEDVLWLSELSDFELLKPIRGGIPLCWPRFGNQDKSMPQHGFARVSLFELIEVREREQESVKVFLKLQDSTQSRKIWDYKFELLVEIIVGETLHIKMKTSNNSLQECLITQAFHSYFCISDIKNICIENLQNKFYLDTLRDEICQESSAIHISCETDRVYQGVEKEIYLIDGVREVCLKSKGSSSLVVWNPWREKCSKMSAMHKDAYKKFVCLESANAFEDCKFIRPQESYTLELEIV